MKDPTFSDRVHGRALRAFGVYYALSNEQLQRLYYSPKSLSYVQDITKQLTKWGYLSNTAFYPRQARVGSTAIVYQLEDKGSKWLQRHGKTISAARRPMVGNYPIDHTGAVNDFLIAAEVFARGSSRVTLAEIRHEMDLKARPFRTKVKVRVGTREVEDDVYYVPDGWFSYHVNTAEGLREECFALEIDMGTEDKTAFQEKIRNLLLWQDQAYEQEFGTDELTVAVVAVRGYRGDDSDAGRVSRVFNLKRWIEGQLTAQKQEARAAQFCILGVDPARVEVEELFYRPIWKHPFGSSSVPLLASRELEAARAS